MDQQLRDRIDQLRAAGLSRRDAHQQAHDEAVAAQDKAWREQDPERQGKIGA